jgi:hypothetical protein
MGVSRPQATKPFESMDFPRSVHIPSMPISGAFKTPVVASQSRTVSSSEPEASTLPSDEKPTAVTLLLWPLSVCLQAPVVVPQSRTVLSHEPEAGTLPSGEKAIV